MAADSITIYKPASITVRAIGGGKYVFDKPATTTLAVFNGLPPDQALFNYLQQQVAVLDKALTDTKAQLAAANAELSKVQAELALAKTSLVYIDTVPSGILAGNLGITGSDGIGTNFEGYVDLIQQ